MNSVRYCVVQRDPATDANAVISGLGRHRGTWDADHGRRQAQRHAATLRRTRPAYRYAVGTTV